MRDGFYENPTAKYLRLHREKKKLDMIILLCSRQKAKNAKKTMILPCENLKAYFLLQIISTTKDRKIFKFESSMITKSKLYANMSHECVTKESHK